MFVVSVAAVIWGVLLGQIGFISRSFVRRKNKKTTYQIVLWRWALTASELCLVLARQDPPRRRGRTTTRRTTARAAAIRIASGCGLLDLIWVKHSFLHGDYRIAAAILKVI
jgi:hypothetical protein